MRLFFLLSDEHTQRRHVSTHNTRDHHKCKSLIWSRRRQGSNCAYFNRMFRDDELEESEKFYVDQPRFLLLFYAMYNTLVARSEMVCYFVIILNHMISASIITLLLPILIFLWAMLSVPRPSRRFWMMAIVYTEVGRSAAWPT